MISSFMGGRRALPPPLPFFSAEVFCRAVVVVARGVDSLGGAAISVPMPIPTLLRLPSLSDEMFDDDDDDRPSGKRGSGERQW